ncbi:MAG: hypothetical protein DME55_04160 [Verrucomicrobia bacterium]|nr:MAG: hypothetical protein DME55_04160 [Verrucomicrobiota bacterium]
MLESCLAIDFGAHRAPRQEISMNRILVIRGGAIGDFILTLPALKALRDTYPDTHIEILGYKHIAALAENRFYAQAVRSIEYGPLSSFFAKNSEISAELADYFASFDLIISYLYDPDQIFENNLRRCGVKKLLCGPARIVETGGHAARQLVRPIEELGIRVADLTEKNWPLQNWIELFSREHYQVEKRPSLIVISGEADEAQSAQLEHTWKNQDIRFAKNLTLPHLAGVLEHSIFIGHDSGISHLAAAAGASCILLFGPTDPNVWAPRNENMQIVAAESGRLNDLGTAPVQAALSRSLRDASSTQ